MIVFFVISEENNQKSESFGTSRYDYLSHYSYTHLEKLPVH